MKLLARLSVFYLPAILLSALATNATADDPGTSVRGAHQKRMVSHIDIRLMPGGVLSGVVLDQQGQAVPGSPVTLLQNERQVVRAITDDSGQFQMTGLRGGSYVLSSGAGAGVYRLWAANTAPPTAQQLAVLYKGPVVRGSGPGYFGGFHWPALRPGMLVKNPVFIGASIATAIAVPLAVHEDQGVDFTNIGGGAAPRTLGLLDEQPGS